jgi:putative DNA primase/helicase
MSQDQKPTSITYAFSKIPAYLRERPQWVCWRYALTKNSKGESKWTKVPYQATRIGAKAISNKRETWSAFEQAVAAYENPASQYDGIGYCLDVEEQIVGIDIDHAVLLNAEGRIESVNDIAKDVMKGMQSYAELSVSGHGIHVFAFGEKPEGRCKKGDFEMYGRDRYLTFTGRKIAGMPATIEERPEQILVVHAKYLAVEPAKERPEANVPPAAPPVVDGDGLADDEILSLARAAQNGQKFRDLYDGQWKAHGYPSQSEGELGLCCMLAFWTRRRADQMDRLFRRSALMREKWDTKRGASTYGADTIAHAIERTTEVYEPSPKPRLGGSVGGFLAPDVEEDGEDNPGGERYTDVTCAGILGQQHQDKLRHADEMKAMWHHWDSTRLAVQSEGVVFPYVAAVAKTLFFEALAETALIKDKDDAHAKRAEMLRRSARRLEGIAGLRAVTAVAREHPKLKISVNQLDQHPYWLNTPGATVDLETGATWPNRIEDLITKVTGARYDPTATCPRWLEFLERILPDEAVRAFMQRTVGYALTDTTSERCLWFLYGSGRNGKSTFLEVVRDMLGDYASNTAASTLMVKAHGDDRRNDVAVLRGARLVTASESEEGQRLAESLIKQLTGGEDKITARLMYAEYFEFKPTFKILLATNAKPIIKGTDPAIWDRVRLVPFEVRIPEEEIDRTLPATLKAERDGILNWAVAGYRAWRDKGLCPPPAVTVATAEYRKEMDHLGGFLEERCVQLDALRGPSSHLYAGYKAWAEANGIRFPMTQKAMSLALQGRGFTTKKGEHGNVWLGLSLRPSTPSTGTRDDDDQPF